MVHVPPDEPRSGGVSRPHGYDPLPVLESLRIPMVWILGGADRGVPTPRSIANLERIQETQPVQFDIWLYPGGDHSLRAVPSGRRIDYWRRIESWLRSHGFLDS